MGGSDLDILGKIFQAFGTPTEAQWPGMRDLPNFVDFQKTVAPPLASIIKGVSLTSPTLSILLTILLSIQLNYYCARRQGSTGHLVSQTTV